MTQTLTREQILFNNLNISIKNKDFEKLLDQDIITPNIMAYSLNYIQNHELLQERNNMRIYFLMAESTKI